MESRSDAEGSTDDGATAKPRRGYGRWVFAAVALSLVLAVVALRARGRRDWPEGAPALPSAPAPPFATEPASYELATRVMNSVPASAPSLNDLARNEGATAAELEAALAPYEPSREGFEALLEAPTPRAPLLRLTDPGPPWLRLLRAADAHLLRARLLALRGDAAGAAQRLARLERFASRLGFGGQGLLGGMIAVAVELKTLRAVELLLAQNPSLDEASLALLGDALLEATALGSVLPTAMAGECQMMEQMLRELGTMSGRQLLSTTAPGSPAVTVPAISLPARWLYDPDRTIAAHRTHCAAVVAALASDARPRPVPRMPTYSHSGVAALWELLDNHAGRVLLSIGGIEVGRYAEREDALRDARAGTLTAVLLLRHERVQGALPATLDALEPTLRALRERGRAQPALEYRPAQRALALSAPLPASLASGEGVPALRAWRLPAPPAPAPVAPSAASAAP